MSESPRVISRTYRPPAVRTWEVHTTGRSATLWVHRTDEGKIELMYGGKEFEIPGDLVEAFGAAVGEAVAWKDKPEEMETVHHA